MKNEIHDSSILMKRLVRILDESIPKPVTILVGSPLTMPRGSSPGVPSVSEMIQLIREELGPESASLGDLDRLPSTEAYQTAFRTLQAVAGQDKVNKVIRDAVLRALRRGSGVPEQIHDKWCELVQYDRDCWYLSPGVKALGEILARYPSTYGRVVLTTNFDPLIEVSIEHHHGRAISTALHSDGSWAFTFGRGCHVVHLHGFWLGSDTLHTPQALTHHRPQLASSLRRLISGGTLLVLAYGGWKDVGTTTLVQLIQEPEAFPDALWTFYEQDENTIQRDQANLIDKLSVGHARGRVTYFKGIDVHEFLPLLSNELREKRPAENLHLFLELTQREFEWHGRSFSRPGYYSSIGEWVKDLKVWGDELPVRAAIAAAEYVLPIYNGSPYWRGDRDTPPALAIQAAFECVQSNDPKLALSCLDLSIAAEKAAEQFSNKPSGDACRAAAQAGLAAASYRGMYTSFPRMLKRQKVFTAHSARHETTT